MSALSKEIPSLAARWRLALVVALSGAIIAFGAASVVGLATPDPEDVVSALQQERTASDTMPATGPDGTPIRTEMIEEGSSVLVHANGNSKYWISESTHEDICVSTLFWPNDDPVGWVFGTGCAPPSEVEREALRLEVTSPYGGIDLFLLPDNAVTTEAASVIASRGGELRSNLVLFEPGTRPDELELPRAGGGTVDLGEGVG